MRRKYGGKRNSLFEYPRIQVMGNNTTLIVKLRRKKNRSLTFLKFSLILRVLKSLAVAAH